MSSSRPNLTQPTLCSLKGSIILSIYRDKFPGNFSSIEVMWISDKYSLVPLEYTEEKYLKKLFSIVHPLNESEDLNLMDLKESGYRLLFSIPKGVVSEMKAHWPDLQLSHQLMPLHHAYLRNTDPIVTSVLTQVYPEFADIIVYQNGKLKLANSFAIQEKTDLVYHLMNIFKHFGLDPATDPLTIVDHYFHGFSGHDSLKKYFRNTQFSKPQIPDANLSLFQAQDLSRYVNLLNLINCA